MFKTTVPFCRLASKAQINARYGLNTGTPGGKTSGRTIQFCEELTNAAFTFGCLYKTVSSSAGIKLTPALLMFSCNEEIKTFITMR